MKMFAVAIAGTLLLGGCATQLAAGIDTATQEGRASADALTQGLLAGVCAATVGSYFRLENPKKQMGLQLICSPGSETLPLAPPETIPTP